MPKTKEPPNLREAAGFSYLSVFEVGNSCSSVGVGLELR